MRGLIFTLDNNLGAYEVGVYSALKKYKKRIKCIVGTGIGSFNAALISAYEFKKLKNIWLDPGLKPILDSLNNNLIPHTKEKASITLKNILAEHSDHSLVIGTLSALVRNYVDESKIRHSRLKFGTISLNFSDLKEMSYYIENISKGKLCESVISSLYLPEARRYNLIPKENKSKLDEVEMLKKLGCNEVIVVGEEVKEYSNIDVSYIHPIKGNNSAQIEGKTSIQNMRRGYLDTLKHLNKIDGEVYYFKKKNYNYFKSINKNVDQELYNVVSLLLKSNDIKTTTIKAVEYVFDIENRELLNIYKIENSLLYCKKLKNVGMVYDYLRSLNI